MYNHALRLTGDWSAAEDVMSETFLAAWRTRDRLEPEGGSVRPWPLGIATHKAENANRSRRGRLAFLARQPRPPSVAGFASEAAGRIDDARRLAALPADPDELLAYLGARTRYEKGEDRDQALFDRIGGLIQGQVMPPSTGAALYRAAARIPGVIEVDEATDALGRHGLGIARDDAHSTERSVWVFDERTLAFLGSRTFFTKDTPMGPAGTLLYSTAVLEQGVVDEEGRRPTGDQVRLVTDGATAAS